MGNSGKKSYRLLEGMQDLLKDETALQFSDFAEVTDSFMEGYARFARLGLPNQAIALAMLGATINLYDMFGMRDDLPNLFRTLADRIEDDNPTH